MVFHEDWNDFVDKIC